MVPWSGGTLIPDGEGMLAQAIAGRRQYMGNESPRDGDESDDDWGSSSGEDSDDDS